METDSRSKTRAENRALSRIYRYHFNELAPIEEKKRRSEILKKLREKYTFREIESALDWLDETGAAQADPLGYLAAGNIAPIVQLVEKLSRTLKAKEPAPVSSLETEERARAIEQERAAVAAFRQEYQSEQERAAVISREVAALNEIYGADSGERLTALAIGRAIERVRVGAPILAKIQDCLAG
ncbi:MAG: hypothetical protein NDJ89_09645 [Oligoflexia bacterium]|nr:hypothetical protein [Oligoflexia bacterium]